jgi:uncharacterized SAM-dependent methyltransferase
MKIRSVKELSAKRRAEILFELEQDPPSIPIKFQYFGKGAAKYDRLSRSSRYIAQSELLLLKNEGLKLVDRVIKSQPSYQIEGINLIDVGCGNGQKGASIISLIRECNTIFKINYVALDISASMRRIASSTVKRQATARGDDILIDPKEIDFEAGSILDTIWELREDERSTNLFLFLGNTLGNFEKWDERRGILKNLAKGMRSTDWLMLGTEMILTSIPNELIETYSDPLVIDFLSTALGLFRIYPKGLRKRGHGRIIPEINKNKDIEINFKFDRASPKITTDDEPIRFIPGTSNDLIRLAYSKRFSHEELMDLLLKASLKCVDEIGNPTGQRIFLCRRRS